MCGVIPCEELPDREKTSAALHRGRSPGPPEHTGCLELSRKDPAKGGDVIGLGKESKRMSWSTTGELWEAEDFKTRSYTEMVNRQKRPGGRVAVRAEATVRGTVVRGPCGGTRRPWRRCGAPLPSASSVPDSFPFPNSLFLEASWRNLYCLQ